MTVPTITPLYAAPLGLFLLLLSVLVIRQRRRSGVALGDGASRPLLRAMRAQGNFVEYVPLTLLLMVLAELQAAGPLWLHLAGALLLAGRLVHAAGVSREPEDFRLRVTGMALTLTALGLAAILALVAGHI